MADNPALMNSLYARQPQAPQKSPVAPIGSSITNPMGGLQKPDMSKVGGVVGPVTQPLPLPVATMPKGPTPWPGNPGPIGPARPQMPLPTKPFPTGPINPGPMGPPRAPLPPAGTGGPVIGTKPGMTSLPLHLQQPVTGGTPPLGAPIPPSNPGNLGPMMPSFGFGGTKTGRAVAGGVPPAGQSNNGKLLTSLMGNK